MQRAAVLSVPLVLVATSLSGCGLLGGSSSLDDALEVVPGSAERMVFVDRAAIAERFEVDDVETGDDEIEEYVDAALEFPMSTELGRFVVLMQDAPFSELDIEWEISSFEGEGFARVWKMQDDLDLDEVGDELVDELGFEEHDESGDARSFTIDTAAIDHEERPYLVSLMNLTIVPDEHLMITGPGAGDALDVVNDDADSAVDSGTFEDLADSTDDVEVAAVARGEQACTLDAYPEEVVEGSGAGELGHPDQSGFFVHGDEGDARSVLVFEDDEAAEEDAQAREAFLEDGTSPVSGVPYSEFGDWEIETDGDQIRIDIDYDEPEIIPAVISRGDYLGVCAPA